MYSFRIWSIASVCIAVQAMSFSAFAQQPARDTPPPPKLEKLEEGEQPAITIRPSPGRTNVTEKRALGGKRTEVKVTTGQSTYYLKPNDQPGSSQPGDAESIGNRPAQWEVMMFDSNRARKEQQQAEVAQATPAPPTLSGSATPQPVKK
jgi:hypothetical protein